MMNYFRFPLCVLGMVQFLCACGAQPESLDRQSSGALETTRSPWVLSDFGRILPLPSTAEDGPLRVSEFLALPQNTSAASKSLARALMADIYRHFSWEPPTASIEESRGTWTGLHTYENGFRLVMDPDVIPRTIAGFQPHHFLMRQEELTSWISTDSWTVVSYRIDPCSVSLPLPQNLLTVPLVDLHLASSSAEGSLEDLLCLPEVRLVAQPFQKGRILPDGEAGIDADDKALHLTYSAIPQDLEEALRTPASTKLLAGNELDWNELVQLTAPYFKNREQIGEARKELVRAARAASEKLTANLSAKSDPLSGVLPNVGAPAKPTFDVARELLSRFCHASSLARVTTMLSGARRLYMLNWTFGSLVAVRTQGSEDTNIRLEPEELGVHWHHGQDTEIRFGKAFDVEFFDVLKNPRSQSTRSGLVDLFDRDFSEENIVRQMASRFGEQETHHYLKSLTFLSGLGRNPESKAQLAQTLGRVIDPRVVNRHSLVCSSCHVADGLVRFQFRDDLQNLRKVYDPLLREGDMTIGEDGSPGFAGTAPFETENTRAFGYFFTTENELVPSISSRALLELKESLKAAERMVD